jgi:hypothetical protein
VRNLLLLLIPLYLGYHLFTLNRESLPSYSEVVLAKSSVELKENPLLFFENSIHQAHNTSSTIQSPLFVLSNAFVAKYIGLNLFSFRLIGVVFTALLVVTLFGYFGFFEKGSYKNASFLLVSAFMIDPVFNQQLHGNAHLVTALVLLLLSMRIEFKKADYTFYSTVISALCFVISTLFYLPVVFVLPVLLLYKIITAIHGLKNGEPHHLYHLFFWVVFVVLFFLPWQLISGIDLVKTVEGIWLSNSWSGGSTLSYPCYFIMLFVVVSLVYSSFQKEYEIEQKGLVLLLSGILISFFAFNTFQITHFILIIPFIYLLIFATLPLNITDNNARVGRYIPLVILLGFNFLIFSIQTISHFFDYQARGGVEMAEFVKKYIPKDKTVIGDATAGFALLEQGYDYQPIYSSLDLSKQIKIGNQEFAAMGIGFENSNQFIASTLEFEGFKSVATLVYTPSVVSEFLGDIGLVSNSEKALYSLHIYQRK